MPENCQSYVAQFSWNHVCIKLMNADIPQWEKKLLADATNVNGCLDWKIWHIKFTREALKSQNAFFFFLILEYSVYGFH